jgi:hypothetical protein
MFNAIEEKIIIGMKEICNITYFIFSGEVTVSTIDIDTGERIPFLLLTEGSCFNFFNPILGDYSLFEVKALTN